ncbi:hypothetical protein ABZS66_26390 [Dactylosporangium sp. NPDC005572]|uniref:hypothetical protein n=1 Tax=Dactylosporangium sp. NPDC005572 TaxID=3156889 RepID=UPI0033B4BD1F
MARHRSAPPLATPASAGVAPGPVDVDADLFEASLMLLAGTPRLQHPGDGRARDAWAVVGDCAGAGLRAEFETEPAAARFADLMRAVPDARCWIRRHVAGIRRRYETFIVDVDGAEPLRVVGRLHGEWTRGVGLLLDDGKADGTSSGTADGAVLRTRAAAVWRCALLTASPRVSHTGLRLRSRDRSSVRLLVRAAQVLGVACRAGSRVVQAEGRGIIVLLSTVRPVPDAWDPSVETHRNLVTKR